MMKFSNSMTFEKIYKYGDFLFFVFPLMDYRGVYRTLTYPANIYLFYINNRNARKRFEICSKLTVKKSELLSMTSSWYF